MIDTAANKTLLGDHRSVGLWLPSGGPVEFDERSTPGGDRELREELSREAEFIRERPGFITVTQTVGPPPHTDVSLGHLLRGEAKAPVDFDRGEFKAIALVRFRGQCRMDDPIRRWRGALRR